jgi:hypothetical protein
MKVFRTSNKDHDIILIVELSLLDMLRMLCKRRMPPIIINTKLDRIDIRHA